MSLEEEVAYLRAENVQLKEQLRLALEQLAQALARIKQLEEELEQIKSTPASPSFAKPSTPKPKDNKDKQSRRKRAKDQNGARRREQTPTRTVEHCLEQCPDCGYSLRQHQLASRRQVIELPPPPPVEVTEHQLYKGWCPRCGRWHYATVDLRGQVIGQGRMGVRIASLVAHLRTSLRMPVPLIREYLYTIHNLTISAGEIVELSHRMVEAEPLKGSASSIKERVRASHVVHGDETTWREKGQNGYIWGFFTPQGERWYEYDHSRGGAVAKRILGSDFKGVLVSDFYCGYNDFPGEHQRCWVHLLRDLHELKEEHKENEEVLAWAGMVRKLYDRAEEWLRLRLRSEHEHGPPCQSSQQEREVMYMQLVEGAKELALRYGAAKPHKEHPCHTLCKRLLRHSHELFQFVLVPGLAADNNLAERSIRHVVVMRKVSGGSQSPKGSATRMTLASLFGTWRAKGLNPFAECLTQLSQPPLTP
jgi:transposase